MNKGIAMKWAEALESGEYIQGRTLLRGADNKMCCLGVLCNLHSQGHPEVVWDKYENYSYLSQITITPIEVARWASLKDQSGSHSVDGEYLELTEMNDEGMTFVEIAKHIREHYEGL